MSMAGSHGSGGSWLPAGTRLNEMYAIDAGIAAGGMGEVYRGHNIQTGDPVAIKMIRSDVADSDAALMLFRKEASALHNLYHESIVRYFGFSVDPALNRPYLAMEYVDGLSISDWLKSGPLSYDQVRVLAARVASGLQVAHERGIVHRDISPDNIIIPEHDVAKAKIIDFGIARQTKASHGTVIGDGFAGKYNYVSPEQLGMFNGDVTPRSDIYSLGLVLAEAIAGRALNMRGSPLEVIEKRRVVPDISHLDPRIQPLIGWMLQPNPDDRPQSMNEVVGWLRRGTMPPGPQWGNYGHDGIDRTVALPGVGRPVSMPGGAMPGSGWPGDPALARAPSQWPQDRPGSQRGAMPAPGGGPPHPSQWPRDGGASAGPMPGYAPHPSQWPHDPAAPRGSQPPGASPVRDQRAALAAEAEKQKKSGAGAFVAAAAAVVLLLAGGGAYLVLGQRTPATPGTVVEAPGAKPAPQVEPRAPAGPGVAEAPEVSPDEVRRYLSEFRRGDCQFVNPVVVAENQAMGEGFARSAQPFQTLDAEFRKTFGFPAALVLRPVSEPQCPIVNLLAESRAGEARRPRLEVVSGVIRDGDYLAGEALAAGADHVSVLIVEEDGMVRPLVKPQKAAGGLPAAFLARVKRQPGEGERPQLVVAVATAQPLAVLQQDRPVAAATFVRQLGEEAARTGDRPAVAAQHLSIQK